VTVPGFLEGLNKITKNINVNSRHLKAVEWNETIDYKEKKRGERRSREKTARRFRRLTIKGFKSIVERLSCVTIFCLNMHKFSSADLKRTSFSYTAFCKTMSPEKATKESLKTETNL
jgi:hypothetical protein